MVWALLKILKAPFGFSLVSHLRMSVCWWFFKPEGSCFSLASDLCTLKNTMTFCVWDKSQMPKTEITSTSVNIKTLIYKCKQDQLPRCQHSYLVCRIVDCGKVSVLLCNSMLMPSQSLKGCSRRKPPLVALSIWMFEGSFGSDFYFCEETPQLRQLFKGKHLIGAGLQLRDWVHYHHGGKDGGMKTSCWRGSQEFYILIGR